MKQKGNIALISITIALVALLILILSISYMIIAQPAKNAGVKNVIDPLDQFPQTKTNPDFITYSDVDESEDSNEDPEISIPDITITHGQIYNLDLDLFASDEEDSHSELDFDIIYVPTFTPAPITLNFDDNTNILTITEVNGVWTGTQSITIEVEDTEGNTDEDTFLISITGGSSNPNAPVINGIPNIILVRGGSDNSIDLDDYVTDPDNLVSEIVWTYSGNNNILLDIATDHVVTISSPSLSWTGNEFITFTAVDPDGNFDSQQIQVTVTSGSAVWNTLSNQNINEDSADGTLVYPNIYSECSDTAPINMNVVSSHPEFNLVFLGNDLVINALQPNWWGTENVVLNCNGVLESFSFTVNRILDDCITICSGNNCEEYCD